MPDHTRADEGEGRYTVVYKGDPAGNRVLNGEPAVGRAVGVMLGDLIERTSQAEAEAARLTAENDHLRASLANSSGPCPYCTLPKEDWSKCASGFPGCGRADDAMLCPNVGAFLDAEASASALRERVDAALTDACRMSAILLMAGEMTAQERRTARAVANGIASKIRTALEAPHADK